MFPNMLNNNSTLINFVCDNLKNQYIKFERFSLRAILTIKIIEVDNLNNTVMEHMPGDLAAEEDNTALYTPEFLNSQNLSILPPRKMNMKIRAAIIL